MKHQEVFKKIGTIIEELNEQYEYLSTTKEPLNDLELELFVANAHFLSEHSEILRKLNLQSIPVPAAAPKPAKSSEEKFFEPVVQQIAPVPEIKPEGKEEPTPKDNPSSEINIGEHDAAEEFSYIRHEPETIRHELILDESELWDDEDDEGFASEELTDIDTETPRRAPIKSPVTTPVPPIAKSRGAETTTEDKPEELLTVNQKISATLKSSGSRITEQLHAQPIADLKTAITLNDKLLYIKDLFNGYNLAYSEAIEILNRFSTFDEADKFLQTSYAVKNHWGSKQATMDKFYELLKRRYP